MPENRNAAEYTIEGRKLTCPVCGQDRFRTEQALLNTSAMAFFGFDRADKKANNYVCAHCGYVLLFLRDKPVP